MKILVVGSGAREHCLAEKLRQSDCVNQLYCAPGNGGTAGLAENVDIAADDIKSLSEFGLSNNIDLTVIGPEIPLAKGIVDNFESKGLKVFGPNQALSRLESSKVFAKEIMEKYDIPTAKFKVFNNPDLAKSYLKENDLPVVIKADGLAAGKGVIICKDSQEAEQAVKTIMVDKKFGQAGDKIIIEECLSGRELSVLVFTDGETIIPLVGSQDHKRAFDKDQGPNTGGMGAYAPTPLLDSEGFNKVIENIFKPLVEGLRKEGKIYKGIIYAGLMISGDKINVLEFNVRLGDPEAQVILPKLKGDLANIFLRATEGKLSEVKVEWDKRASVCVVLASGGYPGEYQKGKEIKGIEEAKKEKDILVYHAGTKKENDKILSNGGRVLSVVALADTLKEAKAKVYQAIGKISFEGMQYRTDIGDKALAGPKSKIQGPKSN